MLCSFEMYFSRILAKIFLCNKYAGHVRLTGIHVLYDVILCFWTNSFRRFEGCNAFIFGVQQPKMSTIYRLYVCMYIKHASQRLQYLTHRCGNIKSRTQGFCLNEQACCILYDAVPILSFISTISFAMCVTKQR